MKILLLIALAIVTVTEATVVYSNQAYPYIPLRLSSGVIAYRSTIIQNTFPIPKHCVEWSDGCTACSCANSVIKTCRTLHAGCQFTRCLPVCTRWASHVYLPPQNCLHWNNGCGATCDVRMHQTQYISSISGAAFIRPIYNQLAHPCAYGGCQASGTCLRHRQCTLTTTQHMECQGLFKTYDPLYRSLGYNSNYVQTYAQTVDGAVTGIPGSHYYAPKIVNPLTPALRTSYADMLSHQSAYLLKHETALKSQLLDPTAAHLYGDVNSYYYHLEQQRNLIDDLHYRVNHGNHYGYYYNPYTDYGLYGGYGGYGYPYGYAGSASEEYKHSVQYGHGPVVPTIEVSEPAAEEEEEGLSAGAIAGIVVGSVVGFLLLLAIIFFACMGGGRSRQMPPPPAYYN